MGKKDKQEDEQSALQAELRRTRIPKKNQVLGVLDRRLGGSRSYVRCMDGKTRTCRIPGRLKRYLWVREGDVVLVEPWELDADEKGDILFKYSKNQVKLLKRRGYLKKMDEFREF